MVFTFEKKAVMPEAEAPWRAVSENIPFNRAEPEQFQSVRDMRHISKESWYQWMAEEVMRAHGQFQTTHFLRISENVGAHLLNAEAGSIPAADGVCIEDQGVQLYSVTAAENSTSASPTVCPLEFTHMADGSREQGNG
jgi:hypothetical protein